MIELLNQLHVAFEFSRPPSPPRSLSSPFLSRPSSWTSLLLPILSPAAPRCEFSPPPASLTSTPSFERSSNPGLTHWSCRVAHKAGHLVGQANSNLDLDHCGGSQCPSHFDRFYYLSLAPIACTIQNRLKTIEHSHFVTAGEISISRAPLLLVLM
jgi:hypothetical protein